MERHDIARIHHDYAQAVRRAREGDLDGVEISCQAGTLIEQFWSPAFNHREDEYGGSLENRLRFGFELLEAVRREVGHDFIVGIRMPGDEMLEGGLNPEDCLEIAKAHALHGHIDFISVVGGQASDYKSSARIWPTMWVPTAPYLHLASAIRAKAKVPVFHATRVTDASTAEYAVVEGHVDMIGMTRAFIADPHFAAKVARGDEVDVRPCVGAGYCVDRVISGKDALCIQNPATGREGKLPHVIAPSAGPRRRVVVVGGGCGGLEAARVSAERGHDVILFEATGALGGQILLAARATWRRELGGIAHWLPNESRRFAWHSLTGRGGDDVTPRVRMRVIVATGACPNRSSTAQKTTTAWDVLGVTPRRAPRACLDENGSHHGPSCAEHLGAAGPRRDRDSGPGPVQRDGGNQPGGASERAVPPRRAHPTRHPARGGTARRQPPDGGPRQHVHRRVRTTRGGPGDRRLRHAAERWPVLRAQAGVDEPRRSRSAGNGRRPAPGTLRKSGRRIPAVPGRGRMDEPQHPRRDARFRCGCC